MLSLPSLWDEAWWETCLRNAASFCLDMTAQSVRDIQISPSLWTSYTFSQIIVQIHIVNLLIFILVFFLFFFFLQLHMKPVVSGDSASTKISLSASNYLLLLLKSIFWNLIQLYFTLVMLPTVSRKKLFVIIKHVSHAATQCVFLSEECYRKAGMAWGLLRLSVI